MMLTAKGDPTTDRRQASRRKDRHKGSHKDSRRDRHMDSHKNGLRDREQCQRRSDFNAVGRALLKRRDLIFTNSLESRSATADAKYDEQKGVLSKCRFIIITTTPTNPPGAGSSLGFRATRTRSFRTFFCSRSLRNQC